MLARSDVCILTAGADKADELVATRQPDLVIVEPRDAGASPSSLRAALDKCGGEGKRLLIVASPAERDAQDGASADGFISRPLTAARLLDAVRRHAPLVERGETRLPFTAMVAYERAGAGGSGYAHDLSVSGMFLGTRGPLERGDEIDLEFALPHTEPHAVRSRARVVRSGNVGASPHRAAGVGLAFVNLAGEHRIEIARWLRSRPHP